MQRFSVPVSPLPPTLSLSPPSFLSFSAYIWLKPEKFCYVKHFLHLTYLKRNTHFYEHFRKYKSLFNCLLFLVYIVDYFTDTHFNQVFSSWWQKKTAFSLKKSLVTCPYLNDLRTAIGMLYLCIIPYRWTCGWQQDSRGFFYDSLSQAKLNIISIIILLQRFTPRLRSMNKVI